MRSPRRYNVALVIAPGFVVTAGIGTLVNARIAAGVTYPVIVGGVFVVMMTAMHAIAGDQHPHDRFGPANAVTAVRLVLVALMAGLVGHATTSPLVWGVVGLTAFIAALDGVDGWFARRSNMASGFGARFDMETDALLILILSILVWQHGKAGAWVLLCGLMRYAFVGAGRLLPWLARPLRGTWRGKAVAVGQLLGLGVALAPAVQRPASAMVAAAALAALTWSFALDIERLRRGDRAT